MTDCSSAYRSTTEPDMHNPIPTFSAVTASISPAHPLPPHNSTGVHRQQESRPVSLFFCPNTNLRESSYMAAIRRIRRIVVRWLDQLATRWLERRF